MLTIQIFFTLWHISWLSIPTAYNSLQSSIVSLRGTSWFNEFLNVLCGHLGYLRHPLPYLGSHIVSDEMVLRFHFSGFKEQELRHLSYWLDGLSFINRHTLSWSFLRGESWVSTYSPFNLCTDILARRTFPTREIILSSSYFPHLVTGNSWLPKLIWYKLRTEFFTPLLYYQPQQKHYGRNTLFA